MHAWLIREERFGEPIKSFQQEVVDVPEIADDEALVYVMAAGVTTTMWAALGIPVNVIKPRNKAGEPEDFHIGGSDASGIVCKGGQKDVTTSRWVTKWSPTAAPGTETAPTFRKAEIQCTPPSFRIWGCETNYGSFAQFTKVQAHQCMPKPNT